MEYRGKPLILSMMLGALVGNSLISHNLLLYIGHAMVSDVSKDSPLHGWIFPSDVLIGESEIIVSSLLGLFQQNSHNRIIAHWPCVSH